MLLTNFMYFDSNENEPSVNAKLVAFDIQTSNSERNDNSSGYESIKVYPGSSSCQDYSELIVASASELKAENSNDKLKLRGMHHSKNIQKIGYDNRSSTLYECNSHNVSFLSNIEAKYDETDLTIPSLNEDTYQYAGTLHANEQSLSSSATNSGERRIKITLQLSTYK